MVTLLTTNFIEKLPQCPWRGVFEHSKRLRGFILKLAVASAGYPSMEVGVTSLDFSRKVIKMVQQSGLLFTALNKAQ